MSFISQWLLISVPTHASPYIRLQGTSLLALTNCESQLSMTELRGAVSPSLQQIYCIHAKWLQANFPGPVPIAFRHLLL